MPEMRFHIRWPDASERVRARYGMPCRRALAQLARIEATAAAFTGLDARVAIEAFDEMNGGAT